MDTIRLRTMSRKSMFHEGKYAGLTVQDILNSGNKSFLRFAYYNYSMISFLPDVLEEIGIKEGYKINKPGKDLEMFDLVRELINSNIGGLKKYRFKQHRNKVKKAQLKSNLIARKYSETKGYLQAKNHGKI